MLTTQQKQSLDKMCVSIRPWVTNSYAEKTGISCTSPYFLYLMWWAMKLKTMKFLLSHIFIMVSMFKRCTEYCSGQWVIITEICEKTSDTPWKMREKKQNWVACVASTDMYKMALVYFQKKPCVWGPSYCEELTRQKLMMLNQSKKISECPCINRLKGLN